MRARDKIALVVIGAIAGFGLDINLRQYPRNLSGFRILELSAKCDRIAGVIADGPPGRACEVGETDRSDLVNWICAGGNKWTPMWKMLVEPDEAKRIISGRSE